MLKGLGMEKQDIINVLDIVKYNQLQYLQWRVVCLRSEINVLEWEKSKSTDHIFELKRMIDELEETLARKRGEMAYLNRQSRKLQQRVINYNTDKLYPITHSEADTDSQSIRIFPNTKE